MRRIIYILLIYKIIKKYINFFYFLFTNIMMKTIQLLIYIMNKTNKKININRNLILINYY